MKKTIIGLVAAVLLNLMMPVIAAAEMREYTDTTGRKIHAEFLRLEGAVAVLRMGGGTEVKVPLERLSEEDQKHIRELPAAAKVVLRPVESVADAAAAIDALVIFGIAHGNEQLKAVHDRNVAREGSQFRPSPSPFVPLMPNPPLTDEQFVRRAHLDIAGRIPTAAEASAFLDDTHPARHARLIDRLLESDGCASHLYNALADMLRIKTNADLSHVRTLAYGDWLKNQLRANRPYDEIVRALITAEGKPWNGPTGFYLRDRGAPMKHLTHLMRAFVATDISCAECHDHPYNDWTQRQFYEMAAFFSGVRTGQIPTPADMNELRDEAARLAAAHGGADFDHIRNVISGVISANRWKVWENPQRTLPLPSDYKYKDGGPGHAVAPTLIRWTTDDAQNPAWVEAAASLKGGGAAARREIFARWLTHPENPRFAMAIAHRLWTRAFGKPIALSYTQGVSLVANLDDADRSTNPELLKHLAAEMVRVKFDLKAFLRIIYNTQAWQRAATVEEVPMGYPYYFQGPVLCRMSAEQVWDSLVTLATGEAARLDRDVSDLYGRSMDIDLADPKLDAKTLLLKVSAARQIEQKERAPRKAPDGSPIKTFAGLKLMRASEHEQPAPPEHALRLFGQSEREWMDSNTTGGSIPQVLALMNGKISQMVTGPDSHVLRVRKEAGPGAAGVESIFLSVLARKPTAQELKRAQSHLNTAGADGWSDLMWALLNSREFIFVQ